MEKYLSLVPAYGRDYKSQKEVKKAFEEGQDFKIMPFGQYANKSQLKGKVLNIRYKSLRSICVIQN